VAAVVAVEDGLVGRRGRRTSRRAVARRGHPTIPLAELEELAPLHGQSDDLLLRQARWHVLLHRDRLLLDILFLRRYPRHVLRRADGRIVVVVVVTVSAKAGHHIKYFEDGS
jgi:hypothetical protein